MPNILISSDGISGKYIDIEPLHVAMTDNHVFAASKDNFYLWHFKAPKAHSSIEMSSRGNKL